MKNLFVWNPVTYCPTCQTNLLKVQVDKSYKVGRHVVCKYQMCCLKCGFETQPVEISDEYTLLESQGNDNSTSVLQYPNLIERFLLRFEKRINKFADWFDKYSKL
jgi:hypothetical protein